MRLSQRLHIMAKQAYEGAVVADIGTDHGLLPLYLLKNKIASKAIFVDISEKALQKAIDNSKIYLASDEFANIDFKERNDENISNCDINSHNSMNDKKMTSIPTSVDFCTMQNEEVSGFYMPAIMNFCVGDGLSALNMGEADIVYIAGMGGNNIVDILSEDINKTRSMGKYVLQARNRISHVKKWLFENKFHIENEFLVRENKYICEIIVARQNNLSKQDKSLKLSSEAEIDLYYEISSAIYSCDKALAIQYLDYKIKINSDILAGLMSSNSSDIFSIDKLKSRISLIHSLKQKVSL